MMWHASEWQFAKPPHRDYYPMWMDDCHVATIYKLLMSCDFKCIAEIGSHHGFSTSALVQAQRDGKQFHAVTIDREDSPQLRRVIAGSRVAFYHGLSTNWLETSTGCDLCIID